MTAPTPEYLRELADLGPMIHIESWDTVCAALRAAADENDRLRKVIKDAPHEEDCRTRFSKNWQNRACDCWKSEAL